MTGLAQAAPAVLSEPRLRGRTYHLTGPETLTFTEQVAILGHVTGLDLQVRAVTREAIAQWAKDNADAFRA